MTHHNLNAGACDTPKNPFMYNSSLLYSIKGLDAQIKYITSENHLLIESLSLIAQTISTLFELIKYLRGVLVWYLQLFVTCSLALHLERIR